MKWRLVAVFVGITVVVLAAHDIPLARYLEAVERDRIVTGIERDAFTIAGRAEDALHTGIAAANPALQVMVDQYRAVGGARVLITDAAGIAMVISDEEAAAGADYRSRPEIAEALAGNPVNGRRVSRTLGTELLYVAVPVISGADVIGAVRITSPSNEVDDRVAGRVRGLLVVALISVAMAAVAAVLLAGTIVRPMRRLRDATDALANGDLAVRAPDREGPPELRGLAAAFNAMSERMSSLLSAQRSFAGDASHQLRTPLTALRLRLEQAADLVDVDPASARLRIEAAGAETERLQHLVDGLLALARAESDVIPRKRVDLAAVVRERADVWQPLAAEQGVGVLVTDAKAVIVMAVPGAVEQIVDNYLDNAREVAPAGSVIELRVEVQGDGIATLHVLDRGPGMTAEQLDRAFDRFWRGAGSVTGGTGLGLAIVEQFARVSGGSAALAVRGDGGIDASASFVVVADWVAD